MQDLFKSKRFWAAVGSVAIILLKDKLPIPLTDEQIQQVIFAIGAWIVGDSLRGVQPKVQS